MAPTELLDRIEEGLDPQTLGALLRDTEPEGLSRALFLRVADLVGSDPRKARALAAHWRPISQHSDDPAYAMRTRAVLDRLDGRWRSSANWFVRAGRAAGESIERLEHPIGAIDSFARSGAWTEAETLAKTLAKGLRLLGRPDLAARAELNLANSLLWQDRYADAGALLARVIEATDSTQLRAAAQLGLSTARLMTGRLEDVSRHAQAAESVFTEAGMTFHAALCELNLAHVDTASGRAEAAIDRLLAIRPILEGDRFESARLEELLGDSYLRLNLVDAAQNCYEAALAKGGIPRLNVAHCRLGLALAAAADERLGEARDLALSAQRTYERAGNTVWAAVAGIARAEIALKGGHLTAARRLAMQAEHTVRLRGAHHHRSRALIVAAEAEEDSARAHALARNALRLIERAGSPDLRWRAHAVLARTSPQGALRHYRRMFEAMLEDRLRTRSTASRSAWMRDKGGALRAYLARLLERPTPARIQETLTAIGRSRSAALLDEILASGALASVDLSALEELRAQLDLAESTEPSGGTRRSASATDLKALQRKWTEATRDLRPEIDARLQHASEIAVFTELPTGLALLHQDRVHHVPLDWSEFEIARRWLSFELLAPQADPDADPARVETMLESLHQALIAPWLSPGEGIVPIAPDGSLWSVPWAALLQLSGAYEPVLVPTPAFGGSGGTVVLPPNPRVALWLGEAPDLPHLEAESRAVLESFPDAMVCRSVAQIRDAMRGGSFDLIHVAAHGRLCTANPMFSALSFPDGAITAAEIATSALRAEIVTLSACESARMGLVHRDEPEGIGRAFLARGAKAVVGASWPLSDEAAAVAMVAYCRRLAAGDSVATCLQHAREVCRRSYRHPYYWGALVALGGYASKEEIH